MIQDVSEPSHDPPPQTLHSWYSRVETNRSTMTKLGRRRRRWRILHREDLRVAMDWRQGANQVYMYVGAHALPPWSSDNPGRSKPRT